LSNTPCSICPFGAPDLERLSLGNPHLPPYPPTRRQTLHVSASEFLSVSAFSFQLGEVCHKRRLQVYFIAPFIEETYQEKNIIFEMGIKFCAF
jgi:hypothetical protein